MRLAVTAALALALLNSQQKLPPGTPAASVDATEWLAAAAEHESGVDDAPLRRIASWGQQRLLRMLAEVRDRKPGDTLNALLERAALLHADISLLARRAGRPLSAEGWESGGTAIVVEDGRRIGSQPLDPQVQFARRVLAAVQPPAPSDGAPPEPAAERKRIADWREAHARNPRIRQWYRAIAADFAARHRLADLRPHLASALEMLPGDVGVRFDAGCLAEVLASPRVQRAVPRLQRSGDQYELLLSASANLTDAERHYRAALQHDPTLSEARVRLARVLSLRGRHRDAIALLEAPVETTNPTVRYYAAIVLADALEHDEQPAAARQTYERASVLFPAAQSPLIARTRLSRELGDAAAAKQSAATMAALPLNEARRDDPWWVYHDCNGRNAAGELEALWRLFRTSEQ